MIFICGGSVDYPKELFEVNYNGALLRNLPGLREIFESVCVRGDTKYGRSNQENLIEQGLAFRMPTGQLPANEVWMLAAMPAHCFKSWLCLLSIGMDKLSWEWKRFSQTLVIVSGRKYMITEDQKDRHSNNCMSDKFMFKLILWNFFSEKRYLQCGHSVAKASISFLHFVQYAIFPFKYYIDFHFCSIISENND